MTDQPATQPIPFDPFAPEVLERSPEAFAELGRQCPVHHYQGRFDFRIASDFQDIREKILSDHQVWSVIGGITPRVAPEKSGGLTTDPPEHMQIRAVIQRGFSPANLQRLAGEIERISDELIDAMLADPVGEGNFFECFAMPMPARLMCIMLGAPESEYLRYKHLADEYQDIEFNEPGKSTQEVAGTIYKDFAVMVATRRALLAETGVEPDMVHVGTLLPDDFMSRFICDRVDGRPLNDHEIISLSMGILIGGNETTMNLICNLLWRLLEQPERWEQIKADPTLIPSAIEESLRFDSPVIGLFRNSTCPTRLQGPDIPAGSKLMYSLAAANRDPARWPNPDEFRLDRPFEQARRHVAFSGGAHACLGMGLARMEVRQVFEKLVLRLPNLRLIGPTQRAPGFNFWGRNVLPVAWK